MARANKKSSSKKSPIKTSKKPTVKKAPTSKKSTARAPGDSNKDRILKAIASRMVFGEDQPSKTLIIQLAQIGSPKSFANTIASLKIKENLVMYDKDSIWLTDEGKDYVGEEAFAAPQSNDDMHNRVRETLKGGKAKKIFDFMLDGKWHSRAEIADHLGDDPTKKGFQNAIGSLSKHVEKKGKSCRLLDYLFPAGRPE